MGAVASAVVIVIVGSVAVRMIVAVSIHAFFVRIVIALMALITASKIFVDTYKMNYFLRSYWQC